MTDEPVEVKEHPCGIHDLVYIAVRAGCPACRAERKANSAIEERDRLVREIDELRAEMARVRSISDLGYSMKNASTLLDDHDRVFLKDILYQWRDHKSVDLRVTEDRRGFSVNGMDGLKIHHCTSMGGFGLAGFLQEAISSYGRAIAMNMLMRGMSEHLQGGS